MVGHQHLGAAVIVEPSSQLTDRTCGSEQGVRRDGAQTADEFRLQKVQLPLEVAPAVGHFFRQRGTIVGRAAFEHVQDVHILSLPRAGFDDLVQELPGATNKRLALAIFIFSRRFAQEAQTRLQLADAEHSLGPLGRQFGAPRTMRHIVPKHIQGRDALGSQERRWA